MNRPCAGVKIRASAVPPQPYPEFFPRAAEPQLKWHGSPDPWPVRHGSGDPCHIKNRRGLRAFAGFCSTGGSGESRGLARGSDYECSGRKAVGWISATKNHTDGTDKQSPSGQSEQSAVKIFASLGCGVSRAGFLRGQTFSATSACCCAKYSGTGAEEGAPLPTCSVPCSCEKAGRPAARYSMLATWAFDSPGGRRRSDRQRKYIRRNNGISDNTKNNGPPWW